MSYRSSSFPRSAGGYRRALAVACLALLAACSQRSAGTADLATEDPPVTALTAPAASPAPAPSPPGEEAEVRASYESFWRTYFEANQDRPGATLEDLALHATGDVLAAVQAETRAHRDAGRVFRRPPDSVAAHEVLAVGVQGDQATVRDCEVNDGWVETVATGERINEGTVTRLGTATLRREGGRWKVADTVVEQTWEGVAGCAAA